MKSEEFTLGFAPNLLGKDHVKTPALRQEQTLQSTPGSPPGPPTADRPGDPWTADAAHRERERELGAVTPLRT